MMHNSYYDMHDNYGKIGELEKLHINKLFAIKQGNMICIKLSRKLGMQQPT